MAAAFDKCTLDALVCSAHRVKPSLMGVCEWLPTWKSGDAINYGGLVFLCGQVGSFRPNYDPASGVITGYRTHYYRHQSGDPTDSGVSLRWLPACGYHQAELTEYVGGSGASFFHS
jgi:hypothetical protein